MVCRREGHAACRWCFVDSTSSLLLRVTTDRKLAGEWELVLLAQGLSPALRPTPGGVEIYVREAEASRARTALLTYDSEKAQRFVDANLPTASAAPMAAGFAAAVIIIIMFWVTTVWLPSIAWFDRGAADSERILHGELWRTVTALTLHADIVHAASNAAGAAIFFGMVSSMTGWGVGTALIILAGASGNLVNAFLHGAPHAAVGASTAIFGAVGLLSGLTVARHRREPSSGRRAWLPVGAAFALLAMLGTAGVRVDIWAHLCGLVIGCILGFAAGFVAQHPPNLRTQRIFGAAAMGVLIYSWMLAFC